MDFYINEQKAHIEASRRTLEAQKLGHTNRASSGWRYVSYGVRRKWRFLWEIYAK